MCTRERGSERETTVPDLGAINRQRAAQNPDSNPSSRLVTVAAAARGGRFLGVTIISKYVKSKSKILESELTPFSGLRNGGGSYLAALGSNPGLFLLPRFA